MALSIASMPADQALDRLRQANRMLIRLLTAAGGTASFDDLAAQMRLHGGFHEYDTRLALASSSAFINDDALVELSK